MKEQIDLVLYGNLAFVELLVAHSEKLGTSILELIFSTARLEIDRKASF